MLHLVDLSRAPLFSAPLDSLCEDRGIARFRFLDDAFFAACELVAAGLIDRENLVIKGSSIFFVLSEQAEKKAAKAARERGGAFVTIILGDGLYIEQCYHSNLETGELSENWATFWPIAQAGLH